jgi:hypothetical protein
MTDLVDYRALLAMTDLVDGRALAFDEGHHHAGDIQAIVAVGQT